MADLTSLTDVELEARWNRLNAEAGPIWKSTDPGHLERMANLRRGGEAVRAEQRRRREAPIIAGANDPIAQGAIYLRDPRRPDTSVGNRSPMQIALRDTALRAIEARHDALSPAAGDRLVAVIESDLAGMDTAYLSAVGDPAFERAFARLLANPTTGHMGFSPEEAEAFRTATRAHEVRAMSFSASGPVTIGSGPDLPVPLSVDPTLTLTGDGVNDPIRALADVRTISGHSYQAATSGTASAHFVAEGTEVSDDTPAISPVTIEPQRAQAWCTYSIEASMDWSGASGELTRVIADAKATLEADMWLNGAGEASNEPEGLLVGGTAYTTSGTVTFDADDLRGAQEDVAPRWQPNAVWLGNLHTRNEIDQLVAAADTSQAPIVDANGRVLRRTYHEVSGMPSAAHTTTPLIYGDLRAGYRIVDRIGMSVELVPHVMGSNRRPLGVRGLYAYWRTSAQVIVPAAYRIVTIA